ncbi:hypothetical protein [Undibacterium curvum]|uniref:Uncharacterized protein n=1 Tax=Undibacterium curvum TaxID=2762294 RepID=A0ABR7A586_9BURK|nr:hypothetical protein [Undibacterium curvum]MBC3931989.1 hypothetical protein [Undibacterium curvum]
MRKSKSKILVCRSGVDDYQNDKYEEVETPAYKRPVPQIGERDRDMELRLVDWGNVVNPVNTSSSQASTFWATRYYEIRNSEFRRELIMRGLIEHKTMLQQIEDQALAELRHQDALLIESAWAKLIDHQQKQALLMRYVYRHKDEYIRNRLKLRGRQNLTLTLWKARTSLKQILEREKNAAIIRPDNLNLFAG